MPMKKTQHYPQCQYVSADGDESVEGDPIVQQMDEHIQSPRDEENSEQRFVGPDNHSASEDEDARQVVPVPTRCLF